MFSGPNAVARSFASLRMAADDSKALAGALQLTNLSSIVDAVTDEAYSGLKAVVCGSAGRDGDEQRYFGNPCLRTSTSE